MKPCGPIGDDGKPELIKGKIFRVTACKGAAKERYGMKIVIMFVWIFL